MTAVKKKMKDKAFARAVNREDIVRGAAELGMPLDDVIAEVITALKSDATDSVLRVLRVEVRHALKTQPFRLARLSS